MPAAIVPATVRCRPRQLKNIDTDRLTRRFAYIQANRVTLARACDARVNLRHLAIELHYLTAEVQRRQAEGEAA